MDVIEKIEALSSRLSKAYQAVQQGKVQWGNPEHTMVVVQGTTGEHHLLVSGLSIGECDCPDYVYRHSELSGWCWHRLAAKIFVKEQINGGAKLHQHSTPVDRINNLRADRDRRGNGSLDSAVLETRSTQT